MTTVNRNQGTQSVGHRHHDETPPPTPVIARSIAFDRGSERATFINPTSGAGRATGRPDPAYIELHNVEAGCTIEMINLSAKPDAEFKGDQVLKIPLTGRDIMNRQAAVYLNNQQLDELGLKAGDMYKIRVVDPHGLPSQAVLGELEPDDYANAFVRDLSPDQQRWVETRGANISGLDGEAQRKNFIAKAINDGRPPLVLEEKLELNTIKFDDKDRGLAQAFIDHEAALTAKFNGGVFRFEQLNDIVSDAGLPEGLRDAAKKLMSNPDLFDRLDLTINYDGAVGPADFKQALALGDDSIVILKADTAVEPRSTVDVFNSSTGEHFQANVGDDQQLFVRLKGLKNGVTLFVTPRDNEGNEGQRVELHYSDCAPKGRLKTHNILGARVTGVI